MIWYESWRAIQGKIRLSVPCRNTVHRHRIRQLHGAKHCVVVIVASKIYVTASAGTLVCAITVEMSLRFVFIHILRIRYVIYLGR